MKIDKKETYNSRDSLIVTDPATNRPLAGFSYGEQTGSWALLRVWSYVTAWRPELAYEWMEGLGCSWARLRCINRSCTRFISVRTSQRTEAWVQEIFVTAVTRQRLQVCFKTVTIRNFGHIVLKFARGVLRIPNCMLRSRVKSHSLSPSSSSYAVFVQSLIIDIEELILTWTR